MKKIHLIGNSHLDPVWLWQWQEDFAEIKATFRSATPFTECISQKMKKRLRIRLYARKTQSKTNIIPTALKKNEDGNGYILRLYEAENTDTDVCINIFGTNINTHFSHNQIKTFLIENGNVKETDFMEWEV